jgi:hypothetical protein
MEAQWKPNNMCGSYEELSRRTEAPPPAAQHISSTQKGIGTSCAAAVLVRSLCTERCKLSLDAPECALHCYACTNMEVTAILAKVTLPLMHR